MKSTPIKNVTAFRVLLPSSGGLAEALNTRPFTELKPHDHASEGFVAVPGCPDADLVITLPGGILAFAMRRDEKIIPANMINTVLSRLSKEIEDREGRKVGRKERRELRDRAIDELRPKAFHRTSVIPCFYIPSSGVLLVGTATTEPAQRIIRQIVRAVESAEFTSMVIDGLQAGLTSKVRAAVDIGDTDIGGFQTAGDFWLEGDLAKVTIRSNAPRRELEEALNDGLQVTGLTLSHGEAVWFKLKDDFRLRQITFLATPEPATDLDDWFDVWARNTAADVTILNGVIADLLALFRREA